MRNIIFKKKGFTIIEMMVTIAILTILTSMILIYSRKNESLTNLMRDADRMIFELRRAQNLSMLTFQRSSSQAICGWGIYIDNNNLPKTQYILFSDFCNLGTQGQYDPDAEEEFDTVNLLNGIEITEVNISSITFIPPEPQVKFNPSLSGDARITMCLEANSSNCFTIHITSAGQIYKEKL